MFSNGSIGELPFASTAQAQADEDIPPGRQLMGNEVASLRKFQSSQFQIYQSPQIENPVLIGASSSEGRYLYYRTSRKDAYWQQFSVPIPVDEVVEEPPIQGHFSNPIHQAVRSSAKSYDGRLSDSLLDEDIAEHFRLAVSNPMSIPIRASASAYWVSINFDIDAVVVQDDPVFQERFDNPFRKSLRAKESGYQFLTKQVDLIAEGLSGPGCPPRIIRPDESIGLSTRSDEEFTGTPRPDESSSRSSRPDECK